MPRIVTRNKKPKIITTESIITSHFKKIKGTSGLELFLISGIYRDRKFIISLTKKSETKLDKLILENCPPSLSLSRTKIQDLIKRQMVFDPKKRCFDLKNQD